MKAEKKQHNYRTTPQYTAPSKQVELNYNAVLSFSHVHGKVMLKTEGRCSKSKNFQTKQQDRLCILFLIKGMQEDPYYRKFMFDSKEGILNISESFLCCKHQLIFKFRMWEQEEKGQPFCFWHSRTGNKIIS